MELDGHGAGDGIRTRDIDLGKVALYQLSYSRTWGIYDFHVWKRIFDCRAPDRSCQIALARVTLPQEQPVTQMFYYRNSFL
jgi:hypothetical protein